MPKQKIHKNPGQKEIKETLLTRANVISFLRIPLVLAAVYLVLCNIYFPAAIVILFVFFLDLLDGYVARRFNEETRFGENVDEIGDRIVENVLFITFAYLQYIPIWAPIIMVIRAIVVDGLVFYYRSSESVAKRSENYNKMIRSDLSRGGYGFLKMLLFVGLAFYTLLDPTFQLVLFVLMVFVILFSIFRGFIKLAEISSRSRFL
jgi:phosphatidylglycerophosphate synthase